MWEYVTSAPGQVNLLAESLGGWERLGSILSSLGGALVGLAILWKSTLLGSKLAYRAGAMLKRRVARAPDPHLQTLLEAIDTPGGDWKRGASTNAPHGELYCTGGVNAAVNLCPGTSEVREIVHLAVCLNGGVPDKTQDVLGDLSDSDRAALTKALTKSIARHEAEAREVKARQRAARKHSATVALQNQRARMDAGTKGTK